MNIISRSFALSACALLLSAVPAAIAGPKDYQVTGPIETLTDSTITLKKGTETWEIGRDATTKGAESLKVGDKVTVHYTMTAASVETKPAAAAAAKTGKKGAKPDAAPAAAPSASPKA